MEGDVAFVEVRAPFPGELAPGRSDLRIAIDHSGARWILRRGPDEAFAYTLSERYFGGVVPPTVLMRRYGTAQLMVEGQTAQGLGGRLLRLARMSRGTLTGLAGMACLDLVMRNRDRHANNWAVSPDGKVWAFDNEVSGEPLRLRQCLRPVYRCVLADDPDFTPGLIDDIEAMLLHFNRDCYLDILESTMQDIKDWRTDLATYGGI